MNTPLALKIAQALRAGMTRPQLALMYITQAADELERQHRQIERLKKEGVKQ